MDNGDALGNNGAVELRRVKVWDLVVRATHASWPVLVAGGILTSGRQASERLHVRLGLVLLGVVVLRVAWGFVGSRHARFSEFVRPPREVLAAARQWVRAEPHHIVGHNPLGGLMALTLLAVMAATCVTGVLIALEGRAPATGLVARVHASSALVLPVLIIIHVVGALFSSALEQQNLVLGMVTGWKRAPVDAALEREPSALGRLAGFAGAAALAIGVTAWLWRRLGA